MIQAIETVYNGYRFRSRLEARWAVFFDAIPWKYEYEPEGYVLEDGTRYLPDFWLPNFGLFVEIKAQEPTEDEQRKARGLWTGTGKPVIVFAGAPWDEQVPRVYANAPYDWYVLFCTYALNHKLAQLAAKQARFEHGETPKAIPSRDPEQRGGWVVRRITPSRFATGGDR